MTKERAPRNIVGFVIPDDLNEQIERRAIYERRARSEVVREALRQYFERIGADQGPPGYKVTTDGA